MRNCFFIIIGLLLTPTLLSQTYTVVVKEDNGKLKVTATPEPGWKGDKLYIEVEEGKLDGLELLVNDKAPAIVLSDINDGDTKKLPLLDIRRDDDGDAKIINFSISIDDKSKLKSLKLKGTDLEEELIGENDDNDSAEPDVPVFTLGIANDELIIQGGDDQKIRDKFHLKLDLGTNKKELIVEIESATKNKSQTLKTSSPGGGAAVTLDAGKDGELFSAALSADDNKTITFSLKVQQIKPVMISLEDSDDTPLRIESAPEEQVEEDDKPEPCYLELGLQANDYFFIPELVALSWKGYGFGAGLHNDYLVRLDLGSPEPGFRFYKRKFLPKGSKYMKDGEKITRDKDESEWKEKKRINPKVQSFVGFHVFGYRPSFDSVSFKHHFESRNLELRNDFNSILGGAIPAAQPEEEVDPDTEPEETNQEAEANSAPDEDEAMENLENAKEFLDTFYKELRAYYEHAILEGYDESRVNLDYKYIIRRLALQLECFKMESKDSEGFVKVIVSFLQRDEFDIESEELSQLKNDLNLTAQKAAQYLDQIRDYSVMKIPPIQIQNEDQLLLNMSFYRNSKELFKRKYAFFSSGGWKLDFSAGFVLNRLMDFEYVIQSGMADLDNDPNTPDVNASQIIKKDEGNFSVDLGVLTHAYMRTGTRTNLGLSTGVVLGSGGRTLKYLAGLSALLGYEQRWIFTAGSVMGYVDRLDNSFEEAKDNYVDPARLASISSSVPVVQRFQSSWFISVSYNLGGTTIGGGANN